MNFRRGSFLFALLFALSVVRVDAQEKNVFGVVEGFWVPHDACELGVGWERIIFDWAQHQPTSPDDWNTLNVDDQWIKVASACNREIVALLKHTPDWATDGLTNAGVPNGLYLPVDDPNNLWATFVRRAAEYYASRGVRRFIVWNEPDITPGTYGFEFEGTVEDYVQMLKVAYLAAKQGNPAAVIHMAGMTYWHDVNAGRPLYLERVLQQIRNDPEAAANGYYFDVATLHIYFRTETVYQITRDTRAILDRYGLQDKSIWIDEMNASPNLDPQWPVSRPNWQIDLDQQGAFIVQAAALGLAAGADHIGVYKLYDGSLPSGAEAFGLIRGDYSRRPAFDSWRMVVDRMGGVTSADFAQSPNIDVVRLNHADGRHTFVAWARTAQFGQLEIGASSDKSQLVDQYGNMMALDPVNGAYTLSLPGALCNERDGCPVGGMVSLLTQPAGEVSVREITPAGAVSLVFE